MSASLVTLVSASINNMDTAIKCIGFALNVTVKITARMIGSFKCFIGVSLICWDTRLPSHYC